MTEGNEKKWISDIIADKYKKWKNEYIALDAGTGCGKSYFCINVLGQYAQRKGSKILYLTNRSALREQVYEDVKRKNLVDTIHVTLYQTLQRDILNGLELKYWNYDYIVADECHYFITDALFNHYTDIAYDYVMNQTDKVVVLVSATAKLLFEDLIQQGKLKKKNSYRIDKDYSYVKKLYYYKKDDIKTIIDSILKKEEDSKILVFCNSMQRMLEMNVLYGEQAQYYCSRGVYKKNEKPKLTPESMQLRKICGWIDDNGNWKDKNNPVHKCKNGNITFDKRILFTTKVLDNGIDLKDKKIKHIFSEILDLDTLIQSLGRKRSLDEEDTCTFYIREYQKKGIQGMVNQTQKPLKQAQLYKDNYLAFKKYYGDKRYWIRKNDIFYTNFDKDKNGIIKMNNCKYMKYRITYNMYVNMKTIGHKQYLMYKLPSDLNVVSEDMIANAEAVDYFLLFLKSIEGKRLYSQDRERIRLEFEKIGLKMRYKGIETFNNTLNGALQDKYNGQYECKFYNQDKNGKRYIDKRTKLGNGEKNPNRDKTYWILENRSEKQD